MRSKISCLALRRSAINMFVHMCVYVYECTCVYMYVCVCVCVCMKRVSQIKIIKGYQFDIEYHVYQLQGLQYTVLY